jgi:predicted aspartyl protease
MKGVLIVPCLLNGIYRCRLLADTGAAFTVISRRAADEMNLDITPVRQMQIVSAHRLAHVPIIHIDAFQAGSQKVKNMEAMVLPLPPELRTDGLLGINFLEKFRVTFEFDQAMLVLR